MGDIGHPTSHWWIYIYSAYALTPQSSDDYQGDLFYLWWWLFYPFWCGTTFVSTLVICCLLTDWFTKMEYLKRRWQHLYALEKALYFFLEKTQTKPKKQAIPVTLLSSFPLFIHCVKLYKWLGLKSLSPCL